MLARSLRFAAFVAPVLVVGGMACESAVDTTPTNDAGTDGTTNTSGQDATVGSSDVTQSGRALVLQARTPVDGATVKVGDTTTKTDADGRYSLVVPRGKPVNLRFTAPEHYELVEQEYVVDKTPYDRGESLMLSFGTANLLRAFLTNYDEKKGLLVVSVVPMKGCATEAGTVLALDTPGATLKYTVGGLPGDGTSLEAGINNGALFYNVAPNVAVKVVAKHPTCAQVTGPVAHQGVTYTDSQTTFGGQSFSVLRVFLGPGAANDAGAADTGTDGSDVDAGAADAGTD